MLFPKQRGGAIEWVQPTPLKILRVLDTLNYTPDYHYGRRTLRAGAETSPARWVVRPRAQWRIIRDHHPGYISREEGARIDALLHGRGSQANRQPPAGRGGALLQSLIACGTCGERWMRMGYVHRDGARVRVGAYRCHRSSGTGEKLHGLSVSARQIDRHVVNEILSTVSPPSIQAALDRIDEAKTLAAGDERVRRRQLEHLEDHVKDLKRQFQAVDPERRHLRVELQSDIDAAILERDEMRARLRDRIPDQATTLTAADAERLIALASDFRAIWEAPTTTNQDRKRLISMVARKIIVTGVSPDWVDFDIEWSTGTRDHHQAPKQGSIDKWIIDRRRARRPIAETVEALAEAGIMSNRGRRLTRKTLGRRLWELGFGTKADRLAALRKIHAKLVARRPRHEILTSLQTEGPQPAQGEWTTSRLATAIQSIRDRRWGDEVPPLTPETPTLRRHAPELIELLIQLRKDRRTLDAVAEALNSRGFKPPRSPRFTKLGVYQLCQRLRDGRVPGFPAVDGLCCPRRCSAAR